MASSNLINKTVKGLSWSTIDSVASQGISFVVGIVLARLLSPEEFGTIGVAMIFVALFNNIVNCGFSSALIRKIDVRNIDYNTTFIFNLIISVFLYAFCFLIAPYIAIFFNNDTLTLVVRWISLVLIINALTIVQFARLNKRIDFKTQAKISVIASLLSGVIGITMASIGCGIWSLVSQQLSRQFCNTILLWIYNKWIPKLEFSRSSFRELFSYGSKLMLSGIIDTLCNELTVIVVGKLYSASTLGQYSRAKQFSNIFSSNLSSITGRVIYPVLCEMQNDKTRLITNYRTIIKSLMLLTSIGTVIVACCAKSIILILIGPKWTEAILYLQLLAFVEITIPLKNINLNLLKVFGRSDYVLILSIMKRIIELGAIFLGFISLSWMLVGFAVAGVVGFILNAFFTMKVSGYSVAKQISDILPSFFICCVMGAAMFPISLLISNYYCCLLLQLGIGTIVLFSLLEFTKLQEYFFLRKTVKKYFVNTIINRINHE